MAMKFVNLPPQLRQLLGNIKLMGWMQPGVKDYQRQLRPLVRQLARHQPGKMPMKVRIVLQRYEEYHVHYHSISLVFIGHAGLRCIFPANDRGLHCSHLDPGIMEMVISSFRITTSLSVSTLTERHPRSAHYDMRKSTPLHHRGLQRVLHQGA